MKQRFFLPLQTCDKESINLVLHDFRRDCFNRFRLGGRNDRGFLIALFVCWKCIDFGGSTDRDVRRVNPSMDASVRVPA